MDYTIAATVIIADVMVVDDQFRHDFDAADERLRHQGPRFLLIRRMIRFQGQDDLR